MSKRNLILLFSIGSLLIISAFIYVNFFQKRISNIPLIKYPKIYKDQSGQTESPRLSILASNLKVPWALIFLPDKKILFTERAGKVRLIDENGNLQASPIEIIDDVKQSGEGGLLGITIHPDFTS